MGNLSDFEISHRVKRKIELGECACLKTMSWLESSRIKTKSQPYSYRSSPRYRLPLIFLSFSGGANASGHIITFPAAAAQQSQSLSAGSGAGQRAATFQTASLVPAGSTGSLGSATGATVMQPVTMGKPVSAVTSHHQPALQPSAGETQNHLFVSLFSRRT